MESVKVIRKHESLEVWQEAMELVTMVYQVTKSLPTTEQFALTSQLKRASVSIPSNIAEGAARDSQKEFLRFLSIARGSLAELETQLQIAQRLGYLKDLQEVYYTTNKVFAKLTALIQMLKRRMGA